MPTISRVYREGSKIEKISSEQLFSGSKCLVDVRGQKIGKNWKPKSGKMGKMIVWSNGCLPL